MNLICPIKRHAVRQAFLQISRLRSSVAVEAERIPYQPRIPKNHSRPAFAAKQRRDQGRAIRPQGNRQGGYGRDNKASVARKDPKTLSGVALIRKLQEYGKANTPDETLKRLANILDLPEHKLHHSAKIWGQGQAQLLENNEELDAGTFQALSSSYTDEGMIAVDRLLARSFLDWLANQEAAPSEVAYRIKALLEATDYRYPIENVPLARKLARKIIMHVGPTNSGKTHTALTALANARVGVYAGPLRLLAHEVFTRFNNGTIGGLNGIPRACNLLTGEEERYMDPLDTLSSCTVEMLPMGRRYDVVVIDEIQMIADPARGSAWTDALLAVEATEIHLCGEESAVDLVKRLAASMGDEVEIRTYTRLSPLQVADASLNDLSRIKKGDCVVTFSRNNIFAVKNAIERKTGLKVAVAYGGLPPEVREEQARSFNSEDGFDVMVASDAIGMGLNLKIRRIIFEAVHKFNGQEVVALEFPQVKQIAGRAGRFGMHIPTSPSAPDIGDEPNMNPSTNSSVGIVTTLDQDDLPALQAAMLKPIKPLERANLTCGSRAIKSAYAAASTRSTLADILIVCHKIGLTTANYRLEPANANLKTATLLDSFKSLSISERLNFANAPINSRDPVLVAAFQSFVSEHLRKGFFDLQNFAANSGALHLVREIILLSTGETDPEDAKRMITPESLQVLESFHRILSLYLWLSYRLPLSFPSPGEARVLRRKAEQAIAIVLSRLAFERQTSPRKPRVTMSQPYTL